MMIQPAGRPRAGRQIARWKEAIFAPVAPIGVDIFQRAATGRASSLDKHFLSFCLLSIHPAASLAEDGAKLAARSRSEAQIRARRTIQPAGSRGIIANSIISFDGRARAHSAPAADRLANVCGVCEAGGGVGGEAH